MKKLILTVNAKMPQNCWGRYAHIGVLELADGYEPKDVHGISTHYKAVAKVIDKIERVHVGKATPKSEYRRALAEVVAEHPDAAIWERAA